MKKEMSSFDVRSVVNEMSALKGAHMDKIFHWGAGNVLFRISVQGEGKKELFFRDKTWLYTPAVKPEVPNVLTSFATFLRKTVDNARIGDVRQVGFDRIVIMDLSKADGDYQLVFELFGGGNVLLVKGGIIQTCLIQKTWRDRKTRPGEEYVMPEVKFDPSRSTEDDFFRLFRSSDANTVRTLASSVKLGGQYAEEICFRAGVDKDAPAQSVDDDSVRLMYRTMTEIMGIILESPQPTAYIEDGRIVDFTPVAFQSHSGMESRSFGTMSELIDAFMADSDAVQEEAYVSPEIIRLEKRIAKQEETLDEYRSEEEGYRRRAEALYTEYQKASELLAVLCEQSSKLTWEKLTEGASKIPFVNGIDPSKGTVTCTLAGETMTLDYSKGLDANASDLYQKGKEIGGKADKAAEALAESRRELEKHLANAEKEKKLAAERVQPTKQFWFERYKWFFTSGGRMVIAGRDAHSNDNIVKKHLKDGDLYAHAEVHGAPSVIVKDGAKASPEELRESCQFALAHSKSWIAALAEGTAFWAYPDQVSKTPNPGEFIPRGAFIIRGKRNYEHHLPLELGIGEILFQGERKVMCAPLQCFEGCEKLLVIRPAEKKKGVKPGAIADRFVVPEEEISRILPPGEVEIVREVWPKEEPEAE